MFINAAHLRSVTMKLKLINNPTADAALRLPRLQQYSC